MNKIEKGLRYDEGKIRHDLLDSYAINELAKVFTYGANKYLPNNWRKGMEWSKVIASLKRHLNAFEQGEDFDNESGLHHVTHAAWNAMTLVSYYKIYPQGDNRQHKYLNTLKIGLDIDDVLAAWFPAWCKRWEINTPTSWYFDRNIANKFDEMRLSNELDDFYLSLTPLINPTDIHFEPHCYITSRPIDISITQQWLDTNGFPQRPVYCVGVNNSKVDIIKEAGCDIFVDDRFENFVEINRAGICCFLFDAPHNQRYDVGYKRIKSLNDLK